MRIRAFFLLSLSAAAAVGLLSAVVTVVSEWRQTSSAAQAQQLALAIRAGLSATEHLALERGYYLADVLAEAAVDRRPDLKVLFMTGYSRNAIVHQGRLDAGVSLIQKPVTSESLATAVRKRLDGER